MRKFVLVAALLCVNGVLSMAQNGPSIIVLYPNNIKASDPIASELKAYEKKADLTEDDRAKFVSSDLPENWRLNRAMVFDFLLEQDFFSLAALSTSNHLTYLLNNYHSSIRSFPVKDVSPASKSSYRSFADKYGVVWIVNFSTFEVSRQSGKAVVKARVQLYNSVSDWIWIDKEYQGSDAEGCDATEWECVLSHLISQATADIYDLMEEKRHFWGDPAKKTQN